MNRANLTTNPPASRCVPLVRWVLAVGLLAGLLFAHGCHADEDHELFTRATAWATGADQ